MRVLALALILSLTTACGSVYRPKAPVPISILSSPYISDLSSPTLIKDYDAIPDGPLKLARRNAILYEYIWLIDSNYDVYESNFFSGQAFVNTAGDILAMGLASAATVTGANTTKTLLAALSVGVVGTRLTYQKNFFDQATRESIVQAMRAARLTTLVSIQEGMNICVKITISCQNPSLSYTLEQGLMDVESYYSAGTVIGALMSISETTSQQAFTARQALKSMRLQGVH